MIKINAKSLVVVMCVFTVYPVMAESFSDNLIIEATPSAEGTVVIYGQPQYQKSFHLTVMTKSREPLSLVKSNGCYKAYDINGNEFDARSIDLQLLGIISSDNVKEGRITFSSKNKNIYNSEFVKWSPLCANDTRLNK